MQHFTRMTVRKEASLVRFAVKEDLKPVNSKLDHPLLKKPRKKEPDFPQLAETDLVRHYYRLARLNFSWEDGLYPLGSCTMKYNPLLNEAVAAEPAFNALHPALPAEHSQGALQIIVETEKMITQLLDLAHVTLAPAAGAHGELTGTMMMRAWFEAKNDKRKYILIPDSAHGTNPASAAMAGFEVKKIAVRPNGTTDLDSLKKALDHETAALMLTNPNTMGIFENEIHEIKKLLDSVGALLYMDGANLNAIVGRVSLGKMGVDLTQLNLHKTFSTPHGGGGPGQGALGVSERMLPFLPGPQLRENAGKIEFFTPEKSIGRIKGSYGQFGNILRAWSYILRWGNQTREISGRAVLNSTYIRKKLGGVLTPASDLPSMHETVYSEKPLKDRGLTTVNLAKALLDRGFYAPTIYFPLNVPGAIMVEPTETESKEELDLFIETVRSIMTEDPEKIRQSPQNAPVIKIDETSAARNPRLSWRM